MRATASGSAASARRTPISLVRCVASLFWWSVRGDVLPNGVLIWKELIDEGLVDHDDRPPLIDVPTIDGATSHDPHAHGVEVPAGDGASERHRRNRAGRKHPT